jgi:hypothetical protein
MHLSSLIDRDESLVDPVCAVTGARFRFESAVYVGDVVERFPLENDHPKDKGGVGSSGGLTATSDALSGETVLSVFFDPDLVKSLSGCPVVQDFASVFPHPFNVFSISSCVPSHNGHEDSVRLSVMNKSMKASFISCSLR